jgi:hypothetical protein
MIQQKIQQEFCHNKYSKNILVRITKIWQNNSSKKDLCKNQYRVISQLSPRNFNMAAICISYFKKIHSKKLKRKRLEEYLKYERNMQKAKELKEK